MTPFGQALRALALNCEQARIFHRLGLRQLIIIIIIGQWNTECAALKWVFYATCLKTKSRVCLATQRKSLRKFNLRLLASTSEFVWLGFNRTAICTRICVV